MPPLNPFVPWPMVASMLLFGLGLMAYCEERDRWGNACFSLRNFALGALLVGIAVYAILQRFGVVP